MNNFSKVSYFFPGYYIAQPKKESGYWTNTSYSSIQKDLSLISYEIKSLIYSLEDMAYYFDEMQKNMDSSDWSYSAYKIKNGVEDSCYVLNKAVNNYLYSINNYLAVIEEAHLGLKNKMNTINKNINKSLDTINYKK